jgi:hypothetical protein
MSLSFKHLKASTFYLLFIHTVLGIKPTALPTLGKHSTTEVPLYPQLLSFILLIYLFN